MPLPTLNVGGRWANEGRRGLPEWEKVTARRLSGKGNAQSPLCL
jgi:hypothetical protein